MASDRRICCETLEYVATHYQGTVYEGERVDELTSMIGSAGLLLALYPLTASGRVSTAKVMLAALRYCPFCGAHLRGGAKKEATDAAV